jgi:integrase
MRKPKLYRKKVGRYLYWHTNACGGKSFGRVGEVSFDEAQSRFYAFLAGVEEDANPERKEEAEPIECVPQRGEPEPIDCLDRTAETEIPSIKSLIGTFVDWLGKNRSASNRENRERDCNRFAEFVGESLASTSVTSRMLEEWRELLAQQEYNLQTILHSETSVRHLFNWAGKHGDIPRSFRPFDDLERTKVPPKVLTGGRLPTREEVRAVLEAATFDPAQFLRYGTKATLERLGGDKAKLKKVDGSDHFPLILTAYWTTGARTGELVKAKVGDFDPRTGQIQLGQHKRSRTQKVGTLRFIQLDEEMVKSLAQVCAGRPPEEVIFKNRKGRPMSVRKLCCRFKSAVGLANLLGTPVKPLTIYDFRHAWISEALMAGLDLLTVSRLAGTSVTMIERVYGHFQVDHLRAAQEKVRAFRDGVKS